MVRPSIGLAQKFGDAEQPRSSNQACIQSAASVTPAKTQTSPALANPIRRIHNGNKLSAFPFRFQAIFCALCQERVLPSSPCNQVDSRVRLWVILNKPTSPEHSEQHPDTLASEMLSRQKLLCPASSRRCF